MSKINTRGVGEKTTRNYILKKADNNAQITSGSQLRQNGEERVQLRISANAILWDYWCSGKQLALRKRPQICPTASLNPKCCKSAALVCTSCAGLRKLGQDPARTGCWLLTRLRLSPRSHPIARRGKETSTAPPYPRGQHPVVLIAVLLEAKSSFLQAQKCAVLNGMD